MKRIVASILLLLILCSSVSCALVFPSSKETTQPAETKAPETTQLPVTKEVLPNAKQFSFVYSDDVSEEIQDFVGDLRFAVKMEILNVDIKINPETETENQIVIGGCGALATEVQKNLELNTYTIRSVKDGDAWKLLVVGNNQRSTLEALKRFEELLREKSWKELLAVNITESLGLRMPKKISVYGDSISTYPAVSNSSLYNSTLSGQVVWYNSNSSNQISKNQTWWSIVLETLGAKLCVDNAYSGDYTYSDVALNRAKNLHRDFGKIENPDTIIVYFGINDCWRRVGTPAPKDFVGCYGDIIRAMKETYPDAQIFCCTLLSGYTYQGDVLAPFNRGIRQVAKAEDVYLIDLDQMIGAEYLAKLPDLTIDGENLHPNADGMKMLGDAVATAINAWYYGE